MNISVKRHNTGNYISKIIQVSYEIDFPDWTGWKLKFQIFPLKQNREQKRYSTLCDSTNVCLQFGGPCLSFISVPNAFFIYFLGVDWWNDPYDDFNGSHQSHHLTIARKIELAGYLIEVVCFGQSFFLLRGSLDYKLVTGEPACGTQRDQL